MTFYLIINNVAAFFLIDNVNNLTEDIIKKIRAYAFYSDKSSFDTDDTWSFSLFNVTNHDEQIINEIKEEIENLGYSETKEA